jgi:hypothetical protein
MNALAAAAETAREPAQRCYECGQTGHVKAECPNADEAAAARAVLQSEGLAGDGNAEAGDADERAVHTLVGTPHADDTLLYVVPCCAPWAATRKWRYRVKITPGVLKRGAAVKQCLGLFLKETPAQDRETALIKVQQFVIQLALSPPSLSLSCRCRSTNYIMFIVDNTVCRCQSNDECYGFERQRAGRCEEKDESRRKTRPQQASAWRQQARQSLTRHNSVVSIKLSKTFYERIRVVRDTTTPTRRSAAHDDDESTPNNSRCPPSIGKRASAAPWLASADAARSSAHRCTNDDSRRPAAAQNRSAPATALRKTGALWQPSRYKNQHVVTLFVKRLH